MPPTHPSSIEILLVEAAAQLVPAPGRTPWVNGWGISEHRNSEDAALPSAGGSVTLTGPGLVSYENAVKRLQNEPAVCERWAVDELWGVVALVLVGASESASAIEVVRLQLARLRCAKPTLVLLLVANISWTATPLVMADTVLGQVGDPLLRAIEDAAHDRQSATADVLDRVAKKHAAPICAISSEAIVLATWCPGQSRLAVQQAESRLHDLIDVALLLEVDPGSLGLYSLRGATNRPGVRGVTVDRAALDALFTASGAQAELAAEVAVIGNGQIGWHVGWHSTEPVPLDRLLADTHRRRLLARCMADQSPIARRLRVAARWYADAHWATNYDDAALALGVALDALIGSQSGLPGRAMRERFALLEPNAACRAARSRRYAEIFAARSAVAHGGSANKIREHGFVRDVAAEVVWTAHRLLALDALCAPVTEQQLDENFEELRWGTRTWT